MLQQLAKLLLLELNQLLSRPDIARNQLGGAVVDNIEVRAIVIPVGKLWLSFEVRVDPSHGHDTTDWRSRPTMRPLWVISRHCITLRGCPLYSQ